MAFIINYGQYLERFLVLAKNVCFKAFFNFKYLFIYYLIIFI